MKSRWSWLGCLLLFIQGLDLNAQDIPVPSPEEQRPGGEATQSRAVSRGVLQQFSATLPLDARMDVTLGRSIFNKLWVSSPSSTTASDGLGPLFNARSCAGCHLQNGRGRTPDTHQNEDKAVSLLLRLSVPQPESMSPAHAEQYKTLGLIPEPVYGAQLQNFSVQGLPAEGQLKVSYEPLSVFFADGEEVILQKPIYSIESLSYGELSTEVRMSARIAPPMHGLGLLEAISEDDLLANEASEAWLELGINGHLNRVWDRQHQQTRIGRFGWKALHPSLHQQNAAALFEDIGISSTFFPEGFGACTPAQTQCLGLPDGNSPHLDGVEASNAMVDLLTSYTRHLAVVDRFESDDETHRQGRQLFYEVGCHACHRPSYQTSSSAPEGLANLTIWPYTDLLLHDMGDGLADDHAEFDAKGREWKTPPLWGVGLAPEINGSRHLLHDGRARNVLEAILWHGGEAQMVRDRFLALDKTSREALLLFIESL